MVNIFEHSSPLHKIQWAISGTACSAYDCFHVTLLLLYQELKRTYMHVLLFNFCLPDQIVCMHVCVIPNYWMVYYRDHQTKFKYNSILYESFCFTVSSNSYRMIPIIPTLREVIDWVFTDTSLTLLHWLRVQELWAQIYKVKVRRVWENVSTCSFYFYRQLRA